MWGPLRLMVLSLSTQSALGQLQYRVQGDHHATTGGIVRIFLSGEDQSLQTAGAMIGADTAGLALVPSQEERDVTALGYDRLDGRELQAADCEFTLQLTGVVAITGAVITVTITITNANGTSVVIVVVVTLLESGIATGQFFIDPALVNEAKVDFCVGCTVVIVAGACSSVCTNYDVVATNTAFLLLIVTLTKIVGDPHMVGMLGQKFDWSGQDKGWYSLVSDAPDFQLNVRVTAPMPEEFPDRQLVTAVSVLSPGGRSLVIELKDPYTIDTEGCTNDSSLPCLADGALRIIVDGAEHRGLQVPSEAVELSGGRFVSSANLPVECRGFGGDRIWAAQYAEMKSDRRSLRAAEKGFDEWILGEDGIAAPTWCAKFLEEEGLPGLFAVQSNHAIFRVVTPAASLRINIGVNYQDLVTSEDGATVLVPELEFWQGDVGVERSLFSDTVSGMLGETSRPVLDEHGLPVMEGLGSIRGTPESYRVDGPYGVDFEQLHH